MCLDLGGSWRCKIWSLPFHRLLPRGPNPGAIQRKEGIKFFHLATLCKFLFHQTWYIGISNSNQEYPDNIIASKFNYTKHESRCIFFFITNGNKALNDWWLTLLMICWVKNESLYSVLIKSWLDCRESHARLVSTLIENWLGTLEGRKSTIWLVVFGANNSFFTCGKATRYYGW